jgi:hypothetical protein
MGLLAQLVVLSFVLRLAVVIFKLVRLLDHFVGYDEDDATTNNTTPKQLNFVGHV